MHKISRFNIFIIIAMIIFNIWSFDEVKFINPELFTVTGTQSEYYSVLFHGIMGTLYSFFIVFLMIFSLYRIFEQYSFKGKEYVKWSIFILYIITTALSENFDTICSLIIQAFFIVSVVSNRIGKTEWFITAIFAVISAFDVLYVLNFKYMELLNYCYLMTILAAIVILSTIGYSITKKSANKAFNVFFSKLSFTAFIFAILNALSMGSLVNTNKDIFQMEHPENAAPLYYLCEGTYLSSPFPFYIKSNECIGGNIDNEEKQSIFFSEHGSARAYIDSLSFAVTNQELVDISKAYYNANKRLDEQSWIEKNRNELYQESILAMNKKPYLVYKDYDASLIKAYESNNMEEVFALIQEEKDMAEAMKKEADKQNKDDEVDVSKFMSPLAYYFNTDSLVK